MSVRQSIRKATLRVDVDGVNVAGVQLPILTLRVLQIGDDRLSEIGITKGGFQIQKAKEKFRGLVECLVKIASLQVIEFSLKNPVTVYSRLLIWLWIR